MDAPAGRRATEIAGGIESHLRRMTHVRIIAVAVIVSCSLTGLAAQDTPLEFDVSSVKPAAPERDMREVTRRPAPGQWKLLSVTLQNAIIIAYPAFRLPGLVVGGPDW